MEDIYFPSDPDCTIGVIRLYGKSTENGIAGIRTTVDALQGVEKIFKYFAMQEELPEFGKNDSDFPIRIEKGSLSIIITSIVGMLSIGGTVYVSNLAKKAATDGLLETGLAKDYDRLARLAFENLMKIVKMGKVLGGIGKEYLSHVKVKIVGELVSIYIDNKPMLQVTLKEYKLFEKCPKQLFSLLASVINQSLEMEFISIQENGQKVSEAITYQDKDYFYIPEDDESFLFPDLAHGEFVSLRGCVTKINEKRQTVGFEYHGHILTCVPCTNDVIPFKEYLISKSKEHFFPLVIMEGQVERISSTGDVKKHKPRIIFNKITSCEDDMDEELF